MNKDEKEERCDELYRQELALSDKNWDLIDERRRVQEYESEYDYLAGRGRQVLEAAFYLTENSRHQFMIFENQKDFEQESALVLERLEEREQKLRKDISDTEDKISELAWERRRLMS